MTVDNLQAAAPVSTVLRDRPGYPERLARRLSDAPAVLNVHGTLPPPERLVALVGARAATADGCAVAREMARALGRAGYGMVSGGALGIDASSHEGALDVQAPTFAVLGCGVDVTYPDRHADLFARIAARGGLLSEYPAGTLPKGGHFPRRNRLIAALADVVVVVEAGWRSGALSTAGWARRLGVSLLALSGSAGTDRLLGQGLATRVRGGGDVLDYLAGRSPVIPVDPVAEPEGPLSPLLAALASGAADAQQVARKLMLPLTEALALLSRAEIEGRVRRLPGAQYEVTRVQ
jgi:DNA processing protein